MKTEKSIGDVGIKVLAFSSLFMFAFGYSNLKLLKYFFVAIGAGYAYFAYRKLIHDKNNNKKTDQAWVFLILGTIIFLFGLVLFVAEYFDEDIYF